MKQPNRSTQALANSLFNCLREEDHKHAIVIPLLITLLKESDQRALSLNILTQKLQDLAHTAVAYGPFSPFITLQGDFPKDLKSIETFIKAAQDLDGEDFSRIFKSFNITGKHRAKALLTRMNQLGEEFNRELLEHGVVAHLLSRDICKSLCHHLPKIPQDSLLNLLTKLSEIHLDDTTTNAQLVELTLKSKLIHPKHRNRFGALHKSFCE